MRQSAGPQADPGVEGGKSVVCLGEVMAQVFPSSSGSLEDAEVFRISHAGAESNVATSLARMGRAVAFASYVGDDPIGRRVLMQLSAAGVDVHLVRSLPDRRTGVFFKDPQPSGSRVFYYRADSAASSMGPELITELFGSPQMEWFHVSGVTSALSDACSHLVADALAECRRREIRSSFDVNYRPRLWPNRNSAAQALAAAANAADVVFVGLDEATALWDIVDGRSLRQILSRPDILVIKDGGRSAAAFGHTWHTSVAALPVEVVEPVGAGDAFAAGWIHAELSGMNADERLRLGHILAAVALRTVQDHALLPSDPDTLKQWAHLSTDWNNVPNLITEG